MFPMFTLTAADYLALLALGMAMSFTPGPNTTLSTALAANLGLRRALRFCLAVPVGWALMLGLCSVGLGAAIQAQPVLRLGIKGIGLGYLLWLAWKLTRTAQLGQIDAARLAWFNRGMAAVLVLTALWMGQA